MQTFNYLVFCGLIMVGKNILHPTNFVASQNWKKARMYCDERNYNWSRRYRNAEENAGNFSRWSESSGYINITSSSSETDFVSLAMIFI